MRFNIKNKKVIIIAIATSIVLSIVVYVINNNRGYQADERKANLGVEGLKEQLEDCNQDVVNGTQQAIESLKGVNPNYKLDEFPNLTQKENDDIIYGFINYSRDIFKSVDTLTEEEFMHKLILPEADTQDLIDFKKNVTPILKDMAKLEDKILDKDFNGSIKKADSDAFSKLTDEYNIYFDRYEDKAFDYNYNK